MSCSALVESNSNPPPADALQNKLIRAREREHGAASPPPNKSLPRSSVRNGRFYLDPVEFPNAVEFGFREFLRWRRTVNALPKYTDESLDDSLPVRTIDSGALSHPPPDGMQATWLGHACCLVQWHGWNVLADPIFSERCSPVQFVGPKRLRSSPCQAADLPDVDAVVISHSHYDHLDVGSVDALVEAFPAIIWFVPLGMKAWMAGCGVRNVVEMDWSESITVECPRRANARPALTVRCIPCQHWCKRTPFDLNKCLWCSWIVSTTDGASYFFGGDTGYCPIFAKAGELYGPLHLSAIPIGAYGDESEAWFHGTSHMNPEEAVLTHVDLKSKHSIGIHWGTFQLTSEDLLEPPRRLKAAVLDKGLAKDAFTVLAHGETKVFAFDGDKDQGGVFASGKEQENGVMKEERNN